MPVTKTYTMTRDSLSTSFPRFDTLGEVQETWSTARLDYIADATKGVTAEALFSEDGLTKQVVLTFTDEASKTAYNDFLKAKNVELSVTPVSEVVTIIAEDATLSISKS